VLSCLSYISASFCETTVEPESRDDESNGNASDENGACNASGNDVVECDVNGRRVSFQLENMPESPSGYLRTGRRSANLLYPYSPSLRVHYCFELM